MITAFVAGYETACRIGAALRPGHYDLGFHSTGTVGCFGAAAACARLLGLDAEATAPALGIAGTQAAGLKSQFGTMCKPFHAGKASQNGLLAARLAARGFSSRADIVECEQGFAATHGPDFSPEAGARRARRRSPHLRQSLQVPCRLLPDARADRMRPPAARGAPADARRRSPASPCGSTRAATGSATSRPRSTGCRASSACARPWRWRWPASIRRASAPTAPRTPRDPALVRLRERIDLDWQDAWPQTLSELEIELADGRRVTARHDAGIPAADIAEQGERLAAKFDALVEPVLGGPRTRELRAMIGSSTGSPISAASPSSLRVSPDPLLGCQRASRKLRLCERAVVLQRGDHAARLGDRRRVDARA